MSDIDIQRLATLEFMKSELDDMQEFMDEFAGQERHALLMEAEAMLLGLDGQARGLIDHMVWRLAQLAAAFLAAALLVGIVLIRLARRGGAPPV